MTEHTYNMTGKQKWPALTEIEALITEMHDNRLSKEIDAIQAKISAAVSLFGLKATFAFGKVNLTGDELAMTAFKAWLDEQQDAKEPS
jgi:hypothetical protein